MRFFVVGDSGALRRVCPPEVSGASEGLACREKALVRRVHSCYRRSGGSSLSQDMRLPADTDDAVRDWWVFVAEGETDRPRSRS